MSALLPCPFCGASAFTNEYRSRDGNTPKSIWSWEVVCRGDDEHHLGWEDTEANAIAAWNRRAPSADARAAEDRRAHVPPPSSTNALILTARPADQLASKPEEAPAHESPAERLVKRGLALRDIRAAEAAMRERAADLVQANAAACSGALRNVLDANSDAIRALPLTTGDES